jgi:hypothetical protein
MATDPIHHNTFLIEKLLSVSPYAFATHTLSRFNLAHDYLLIFNSLKIWIAHG